VFSLPTGNGVNQDSWNYSFLHEFSHGMTLSQYTGVGPDWIAEGYADSGAMLIRRAMGGNTGIHSMPIINYDILRLGGKEIVGGIPGKEWRGDDTVSLSLNEESGTELFLMLAMTQSGCMPGDWQNCTALGDLKTAQYGIANQKQTYLDEDDFFSAEGAAFSQPIEGALPDTWTENQPVAYTYGTPGTYLFVYGAQTANPKWLEFAAFQRLDQDIQPGVRKEIACTSGTVTAQITNSAGAVATISLDLSNTGHELDYDTTGYALGAYRIRASGTCNGTAVTAPDSYFGVYDRSLVPPGKDIGTLASVFFLIGKNADGTPSAKSLPAPTGGPAGQFLENGNGVAIWQVNATGPNPQAEYDWLGRRLPVPLPFSPVYLGTN
jgi:hypothetical protein